MYPGIPLGTCCKSLGIRGVLRENHWVRVFWNTATVVWYTVAVGMALTPHITRIMDYNACPVFLCSFGSEAVEIRLCAQITRFAGWELRRTLRAKKARTLHPCVCAYVTETEKLVPQLGREKYVDAEVSFASLKYEQIRSAVLSVPAIEIQYISFLRLGNV